MAINLNESASSELAVAAWQVVGFWD